MDGGTQTVAKSARPVVHIDWRIAMACAVILALISSMTVMPRVNYAALPGFPHTILPQMIAWGTWLPLIPLVFAVARNANVRRMHDRRGILLLVAGSILLPVLHIVILVLVRKAVGIAGPQPLSTLIPGMIRLTFAANFIHYWLITGAYFALAYQSEVRERAVNEERLNTRLAEARLEALEGRMHPHFLFNTLNAIATLIHRDPKAAALMVENLGDLLRAALHAQPGHKVALTHELALLDRYVEIQRARFSDRLVVVVDANADVLQAIVPHMLLQPLVENSIRHGIAPREAPGTVKIEAARQGTMLRLVVRDDGVGFGKATQAVIPGSGFGLSSTRARLEHLYGRVFSFEISDEEPTGTAVTIEIPFQTEYKPAGHVNGAPGVERTNIVAEAESGQSVPL